MADELLIAGIGAGAAIVGGLVTGAFEYIQQWWTRPKLKLDYVSGPANRTESTYQANDQTITEIFIRARIRNTGKRIAKDCRVFLVSIVEVHQASIHETSYHDSMALAWPGYPREFGARAIPKGIDTYVDVVSVRKNEAGWRFQVKSLYASHQALKAFKGTYRLTLLATADNAEPIQLMIDITYNQDWNSLRASTH